MLHLGCNFPKKRLQFCSKTLVPTTTRDETQDNITHDALVLIQVSLMGFKIRTNYWKAKGLSMGSYKKPAVGANSMNISTPGPFLGSKRTTILL
jgi:hypothetical protein